MALILSLLIHAALIGSLLLPYMSSGPRSLSRSDLSSGSNPTHRLGDRSGSKHPFSPPPQPILIELVEPPSASNEGLRSAKKPAKCKHPYDGIGVMTSPNGWYREITEVPAGYPAANAGIKPGDLLIDKTELLGPPGSVVRVTVDRKGEILVFDITRARICTE